MTDTLKRLGYAPFFQEALDRLERPDLVPGRIAEVHAERYTVQTASTICSADITGNLRYSLEERADFPTVGDWVAVAHVGAQTLIHHRLPRRTELARRSVSGRAERQVIGANIDVALIMQAVDRDFNLNRLERYLAVAYGAGIEPLLLLSKSDLASASELASINTAVSTRHPALESVGINCRVESGLDALYPRIEVEKTYCVLGSSGTGKSTLVNALLGEQRLETREISSWNQRGKHTTTFRALFVLPSGGIIIDTPGMREIGGIEGGDGLEKTFDDIYALAKTCRFSDCQHEDEPGCAVQAAIESGELDPAKFDNFSRLARETAHFESSVAERRKKARSQGKLYKKIQGEKRKRHFQD